MALEDILEKIESDANAEAEIILAEAHRQADAIVAQYEAVAAAERADAHTRAEQGALQRAETIRVNARLRERDLTLALKRDFIERALAAVREAVAALPDDRYAALMGSEVARAARGGERYRIGRLDSSRAAAIDAALQRAWSQSGQPPVQAGEPAPFDRGILLEGDRTQVDLSVSAIVEARRREIEPVLAGALFGSDGGSATEVVRAGTGEVA